jgi:hypothetical protein
MGVAVSADVIRLKFPRRPKGEPRATPGEVLPFSYGSSTTLVALARDASRRAAEATTAKERATALADMKAFDEQAARARRLENHRAELSRGAATLLDHIGRQLARERGEPA